MTDYADFIDHTLIDAAIAALAAARARMESLREDLALETAAHETARIASESAIAGDGTDPHQAEAVLLAAARSLDVVTRVLAAASRASVDAKAGLAKAIGVAHRGVYREGVRLRLAAARRADAARAELSAAEADYSAATATLNFATKQGCQDVIFDAAHSRPMTTHAAEIAQWSVGYHNAWWPGLSEAGKVI